MTPATTFAGRRVALFGLGGSGLATARALQAGGADVLASDDSPASLERAQAHGITTGDLREADWSGFAALILSPGVPLTHPAPHWTVERARAAGIEIIGDVELFCRERARLAPTAPFVAITGTNGKSTTTALVAHILRAAGRDVQMGGNIGTAILSLEPPAMGRVHVIEMSSYQIDLTPSLGGAPRSLIPPLQGRADSCEARAGWGEPAGLSPPRSASPTRPSPAGEGSGGPTVGVLLNISPDHLDRHGTMENYAAIKARVVAASGTAIVGLEDGSSRAIAEARAASGRRLLLVSGQGLAADGMRVDGTELVRVGEGMASPLVDLSEIGSLRGAHNAQNAAAAALVVEALGLDEDQVGRGLRSFPGLHHRMEEVGRRDRAIFVNDSKATNADSAEKALLSFDRVFWILGGKAKEGGIAPLRPHFHKVERAYLIGEAAADFAATLDEDVPHALCGTLDRAVAAAAADAACSPSKDPVILLSPACASFDQYPNFEKRGDHFRELVRALPGVEMRS